MAEVTKVESMMMSLNMNLNNIIGDQKNVDAMEVSSTTPEDRGRSEAKFQFRVEQFSKLQDWTLSGPCYVQNLPWKIMIRRKETQKRNGLPQSFLSFFLQCNGESESESWFCNAIAELRLLSVEEDHEPVIKKIQHSFYSEMNDWGFTFFIPFSDVLNPENGYIEDDTVTLEVWLSADEPQDGERSEATFQFRVEQFSKLKEWRLSDPCYVQNLPWKIFIRRKETQILNGQRKSSLAFFLQCNRESKSESWSCNAFAELRLLSVREGHEPFARKIHHSFCSKEDDWGYMHFIAFDDVLDPENGYIKGDAVTLEVWLSAYESQDV